MQPLQRQIEIRIEAMVGDIITMVRQAAVSAVDNALQGVRGKHPNLQRKQSAESVKPKPERSCAALPRRSSEEIAELGEQLYAVICEQPGATMDMLANQLRVPSARLALPVQQLCRTGRVRKAGERNHTRYFPMNGAAAARS